MVFDGRALAFLDGGFGTMVLAAGLPPGKDPTAWNVDNPDAVAAVHLAIARQGAGVKVALDIGPTGRLLKPAGDLDFDEAFGAFSEMVRAGAAAGADLVFVETMGDARELKAAVLAAKLNSDLPVVATVALDESGKLLTGASVECVAALLESLGEDLAICTVSNVGGFLTALNPFYWHIKDLTGRFCRSLSHRLLNILDREVGFLACASFSISVWDPRANSVDKSASESFISNSVLGKI